MYFPERRTFAKPEVTTDAQIAEGNACSNVDFCKTVQFSWGPCYHSGSAYYSGSFVCETTRHYSGSFDAVLGKCVNSTWTSVGIPMQYSKNCSNINGGGASGYYDQAVRECMCPDDTYWVPQANSGAGWCVPRRDLYSAPDTCLKLGKPIVPLAGSKERRLELGYWLGVPFSLTYDSRQKLAPAEIAYSAQSAPSFGEMWQSNVHRQLRVQSSPGAANAVQVHRGSHRWVSFAKTPTDYAPNPDLRDRLTSIGSGWLRYFDADSGALEDYDNTGKLQKMVLSSGKTLTFEYSTSSTPANVAPSPDLLIAVRDPFGRAVQFNYEKPADAKLSARVTRIVDPNGQPVAFTYDTNGQLASVAFPDGRGQKFLYELPALPWALTSVLDENGVRSVEYGYDADGYAISTQDGIGTNRYAATWQSKPAWAVEEAYDDVAKVIWRKHYMNPPAGTSVTLPTGQTVSLTTKTVAGVTRLASQTQPAGSGCGASSSSQEYDAQGNVTQRDDFSGGRVCMGYDLSRNLENARVEGLTSSGFCSGLTAVNAALPSGTRKISTAWHPDWSLAVKVAEPKRLTTHVYNGQPDPFAGNAIARCAPDSAKLPDGKLIAVLCKTVEQATYDASGGSGFAAVLDTSVPNRVWTYTYNEFGQVLTSRDPRNNVTTNSYYATTTADYTRGDLEKTTNALNQTTRFTKYNPMGQVLQSIDANNVTTDYQYDLRARLTRQTTGGQSTGYDYWPTGQLKRVTQPDTSYVNYEYDPAQRLVAVADNLGNRIEYTLDNSGNRREERIKDPSGILKRQVGRVFDALGRAQQVTGRE